MHRPLRTTILVLNHLVIHNHDTCYRNTHIFLHLRLYLRHTYDVYSSSMQNPYLYNDNKYDVMNSTSTTCTIRGSVGHTLYPICGSWNLANNAIGTSIFTSHWIWLVWASCLMWLPICTIKHWYRGKVSCYKPRSWSLPSIYARYTWIGRVYRELGTCRTWTLFSCISWSLCFGCQFYLFSVYFKHSVISQQWSFGQIIAVTVWVPSVVEYIYIEYSTSRHVNTTEEEC